MAPESLTILVAFSAGLLSFLSPCVLPLVPSYITFITGLGLEDVSRARRTTFVHALLFVLGFSFIFVSKPFPTIPGLECFGLVLTTVLSSLGLILFLYGIVLVLATVLTIFKVLEIVP